MGQIRLEVKKAKGDSSKFSFNVEKTAYFNMAIQITFKCHARIGAVNRNVLVHQ